MGVSTRWGGVHQIGVCPPDSSSYVGIIICCSSIKAISLSLIHIDGYLIT